MEVKNCKTGKIVLREIQPRIGKVIVLIDGCVQIDSIKSIDGFCKTIITLLGNEYNIDHKFYEMAIEYDRNAVKVLNFNQWTYNYKHIGKEVIFYQEKNRDVVRVKNLTPVEQAEMFKELNSLKRNQ